MRRVVLALMLVGWLAHEAFAQPGCVQLGSGAFNMYTGSTSGFSGVDHDNGTFNLSGLNGPFTVLWIFHSGFGELIYQDSDAGGGPNLDRAIIQVRVNFPSAGQTRVSVHGKTTNGNVLYTTYGMAALPGPAEWTVNRIANHGDWVDSSPASLTFTPCQVISCQNECDPQCRQDMEDPCTSNANPDVCDECWCDPAWRQEHGVPCPDLNDNGVCDETECECDPATRAAIGNPCDDDDEDGRCDECGEDPCEGEPDSDEDGICNPCDVDYRAAQENPCEDANENGECDECEEDCDDCNPCNYLRQILAILQRWDENQSTGPEGGSPQISGPSSGPSVTPLGLNVTRPEIELSSQFSDFHVALPRPGGGEWAWRLSARPENWTGYGVLPNSAQGAAVVGAMETLRQVVRLGLSMLVGWTFVTRTMRLFFTV